MIATLGGIQNSNVALPREKRLNIFASALKASVAFKEGSFCSDFGVQ